MRHIGDMLKKARSVVLRRGANADDADDIVQEAFARLEAYTRAHEVKSQEAFLVRAAVNIARDQARRRKRAPFDTGEVDLQEIQDDAVQPDEILRARQRLRRANAGLDQLTPRARRILIAQRLEGLPYKEIAEREDMSIAAVEKQVARAVLFLMKWMDGW